MTYALRTLNKINLSSASLFDFICVEVVQDCLPCLVKIKMQKKFLVLQKDCNKIMYCKGKLL